MRGGRTSPGSRGDGAARQLLEEQGHAGTPLDDQAALLRRRARRRSARRPDPPPPSSCSGSSSMSTTDDAQGAVRACSAGDQNHRAGDALGGQEAQQVDGRRIGPVEVLGHTKSASTPRHEASHATRAWSVCWRSARASTSGRAHRSSLPESESGREQGHGVLPADRPLPCGPPIHVEPFARRLVRDRTRGAARACGRRARARRCRDRASSRTRGRDPPRFARARRARRPAPTSPCPATPRTTTTVSSGRVAPPSSCMTCLQMKRRRRLWLSRPIRATDSGNPRPDGAAAGSSAPHGRAPSGGRCPSAQRAPTACSSKCGSTSLPAWSR